MPTTRKTHTHLRRIIDSFIFARTFTAVAHPAVPVAKLVVVVGVAVVVVVAVAVVIVVVTLEPPPPGVRFALTRQVRVSVGTIPVFAPWIAGAAGVVTYGNACEVGRSIKLVTLRTGLVRVQRQPKLARAVVPLRARGTHRARCFYGGWASGAGGEVDSNRVKLRQSASPKRRGRRC